MSKPRLGQLNRQLKEEAESSPSPHKGDQTPMEANPERGQRSSFLKVTITLPHEMLSALRDFGMKRRTQGMKNTDVSSLIREAVAKLLEGD